MSSKEEFFSHLLELRNRLLKIVAGILVVMLALVPFANDIYQFLATPLLQALPEGGQMIATEVTTPFFVPLKVVMLSAFILSSPYTLYQIWAFIAPGLYANERHLVVPLVVTSVFLFLCGIAFAYFLVFPVVFSFITSTAPEGVAVMTDIGKYLDFAIGLFIAFSLAFETPVAVVLMVAAGMVSIVALKQARAYVIVGAFVVGAIITPPDIISQFMLAIPMWMLYEIGILVASVIQQKKHHQFEQPS